MVDKRAAAEAAAVRSSCKLLHASKYRGEGLICYPVVAHECFLALC